MDYDDAYRTIEDMFGPDPEQILVDHYHLLDNRRPVLDVGCGQGRNTLFLARRGIRVTALDPSAVALGTIEKSARRDDLPVDTVHGGFASLAAAPESFGGVLVFGLVPDLPRPMVDELLPMVRNWTAPSGLLWLTVFTTADPRFDDHSRQWRPLGRNSFQGPGGQVRTYLESGELQALFADFEVIHYWEGLGPEHRHGDGPPERHAKAEAVFRKPA